MRVTVIARATRTSGACSARDGGTPTAPGIVDEEFVSAGVPLAANGCRPRVLGRHEPSGSRRSVTGVPARGVNGPTAGFSPGRMRSVGDALEWLRRAPQAALRKRAGRQVKAAPATAPVAAWRPQ